MEIFMFAEAADNAYDLFKAARAVFEPAFNNWFRDRDYGPGIIGLHHTAIIHEVEREGAAERKLYRQNSHEAVFALRIYYPHHDDGLDCALMPMLVDSVGRALVMLPTLVDDFPAIFPGYERLLSDYVAFVQSMGWGEALDLTALPRLRRKTRTVRPLSTCLCGSAMA